MSRLPHATSAHPDSAAMAQRLLRIVRQTVAELRPDAAQDTPVSLHSVLDSDLGLDSLARVELWSRVEREFGVRLPEALFAAAETLGDLLEALLACAPAVGTTPRDSVERVLAGPQERLRPDAAQTLIEVLDWHVQQHPQRIHVRLLGDSDEPEDLSYLALQQGARAVACGLQQRGLRAGQRVALMLPTGRDFLFAFFGILLAGGVPVPIYPPVRLSQIEEHLRRQAGILANAEATMLITVSEAKLLARLLKSQVPSLHEIASVAELSAVPGTFLAITRQAGDLAFLQYTSGSTGQPKGVMISHANLLANMRAMGTALHVSADDVFVSWLPMYHDMGLIGAWLGSLYYGFVLVLMSPLAFLARPVRWLQTIHRYRATLSAAPNFAYELCLSKLADSELQGLDLSSWRLACNGAEPVSPHTLQGFAERFGRYGLQPGALAPVYGLAEATLGVAFPPVGRGPLIDWVQREPFQARGKALCAEPGSVDALRFVSCGRPLPGHQVRIVDDHDIELPERTEGHLQFKGPSTSSGYFHNPQESLRVRHGEWLDSLDLAYMAAGEVYLSGRAKDLIIRGGRNIYPYDLEAAVGNVPGLRKGCVAVFGSGDPASASERLVVLAETSEKDARTRQRLQQQIRRVATDLTGVPPDDIVLAPPHSVLKTSSGKIRRAASRELYERGEVGRPGRPVWRQLLRLLQSAARAQLGRGWQSILALCYAGYFWALLGVLGSLTWAAVVVLPQQTWRRRFTKAAARLFLRLAGIPLQVEGLDRLRQQAVRVLVANHASYLDGVLLCAALPPEFSFVAKRELGEQRIAGPFLRKLGTCFVERFDLQRSADDAERLAHALQAGQSLVFFPEGTLTREPGLLPFRMGAFVLAARAAVPLIPVAIGGSRMVLRGDQWFPHRGAIHLQLCAQLLAQGPDWLDAIKLRDSARAELLQRLDEPDRQLLAG